MHLRKSALVCLLSFTILCGTPSKSNAEPMRDFVMSCSYGVLAGTLVGAATLAFSDKPGDDLNNVARGASLGLYAGILLGLYVATGGPSESEEDLDRLGKSLELSSEKPQLRQASLRYKSPQATRFMLAPVITERGLDGAAAHLQVLSF